MESMVIKPRESVYSSGIIASLKIDAESGEKSTRRRATPALDAGFPLESKICATIPLVVSLPGPPEIGSSGFEQEKESRITKSRSNRFIMMTSPSFFLLSLKETSVHSVEIRHYH